MANRFDDGNARTETVQGHTTRYGAVAAPQPPPAPGDVRFCRRCGKQLSYGVCPDHPHLSRAVAPPVPEGRRPQGVIAPTRRPDSVPRPLLMVAAAVIVALAVVSGLLMAQVGSLRSDLQAAGARAARDRLNLQQQVGQLSNALSGISSRLSALEGAVKSQPNPAAIAKTVEASLFVIETDSGSGSGFAVSTRTSHTEVLTNYHVVASQDGSTYSHTVKVVQRDETFTGTVTRIDRTGDLALIDVGAIFPQLPVERTTPAPGDTVYAFGAPLGAQLEDTVTEGVVSGTRFFDGLDRLQFSAQINPGNSGGPVVDAAGKVVGLSELGIDNTQGLFFAVPIERACETVVGC